MRRFALLVLMAGLVVRAQDMSAPATQIEHAERPSKAAVEGLPWLQTLVDATPAGGTLNLEPGRYSGPVLVTRPIVIDGHGQATITNGDTGTVFTLETSKATLMHLTFTGSGDSHNTDDACLNVRGD